MDNLIEKVETELKTRSVVLVGPSDSGKTHWVQYTLIPYFEAKGQKVEYLKDGDQALTGSPDIVICDEGEVLSDQKYLQGNSSEPYYSDEYLAKVHRWFANYSLLPQKTIFIVTRNQQDQIENLVQNMHQADWDGRDLTVIEFKKSSL